MKKFLKSLITSFRRMKKKDFLAVHVFGNGLFSSVYEYRLKWIPNVRSHSPPKIKEETQMCVGWPPCTYLAGLPLGQQVVPEQRGPGLVGGQLPLQVAAAALARVRRLHRHHARALRHAPRRHVQVDDTLRTRRRDKPVRLLNPVCQTGLREHSPFIKKIVMAHTVETKFTHCSLDSVVSSYRERYRGS